MLGQIAGIVKRGRRVKNSNDQKEENSGHLKTGNRSSNTVLMSAKR